MTLHLFVIFFIQLFFLLLQKRMSKEPGNNNFQASLNILIIYLVLPLSFPGMTVIADFFFEGFTDNLIWYSLVFVPLWIFSVYWMKRNLQLKNDRGWVRKAWIVGMNSLLLIGYICAIFSSHHEHGPTPSVRDSPYLTGYFIGIHATVVIGLTMQVWLLVKSSWSSSFIWINMLFTVLAMAIYLAILFSMSTQMNF